MKFLLVFRLEKQPWKHFLCPEHSINTFLGITTHGALSAFTFVFSVSAFLFSLCFLIVLLPLLHTCICFLCIHTIQSIYFAHSFFQTLYIVTFILSHSVVLFCVIYSFIYIILHKFPIKSCSHSSSSVPLSLSGSFSAQRCLIGLSRTVLPSGLGGHRSGSDPSLCLSDSLWPLGTKAPLRALQPAPTLPISREWSGRKERVTEGAGWAETLYVSVCVSVNTLDEPSALLLLL